MITQENRGSGMNNAAMGDINLITESNKIASNFSEIINILGKQLASDTADLIGPSDSFNIENKIQYNNVVNYKKIIDEYKIFVGKLGSIYKQFDQEGTNKTFNTLSNIKLHYIKVLNEFKDLSPGKPEMEVIQENADNIISEVEKRLLKEIEKSCNIVETKDAINISLQVIIIDAFMKCKLLEEPPK